MPPEPEVALQLPPRAWCSWVVYRAGHEPETRHWLRNRLDAGLVREAARMNGLTEWELKMEMSDRPRYYFCVRPTTVLTHDPPEGAREDPGHDA